MQVDSKSIESLFPKYKSLFEAEVERPNEQLEYFIKEQLPELIKILQNLDSTFTKLTHTHNTLIMKKMPAQTLFQSFVRKVGDKIEKYFNSLDDVASKVQENSTVFDFQRTRADLKQDLESILELLIKKLSGKGKNIDRSKEQQLAQSLYTIIEYYQWTKSDTTAISSKFRLDPSAILSDIKQKSSPSDPWGIVSLESTFKDTVADYVNKKCRPFLQKRDFLINKVKEICKQTDSRSAIIQPKQYLRAILTRETMRCDRDIIKAVQQQVKSIQLSKHYQDQIPEINQDLSQVKTQFQRLKNSNYYLDIIRGNFIQTYQMETKKLENVFTIGRLEKYLQEVYALSERMRVLLDRIIDNRKGEKLQLGDQLESAVDKAIGNLSQNFKVGPSLADLSSDEISHLRNILEDLPDEEITNMVNVDAASRYRQQQKTRERERQSRLAAERQRRDDDARKKKQDLQQRAERERQNKQEKKQEEQQRQRKLEQQRHDREERRRIEAQQQRIRADEDKIRRQREQEEEKQKRQRDEQVRKRQLEERRKQQEIQEQRRKQQAQEKQKQLEQEKARKAEKDKQERERLKLVEQQRKKQRQSAEERRKQDQLKKQQEKQKQIEEQKRIKADKEAEQKRKDDQRRTAEQTRIQREKQQAKKKEDQRIEKQTLEKKKKQQEKKEFQRRQKQRLETDKKQRQRLQQERKQKQRIEKERKQKEKIQLERKQQQRKENQRLQKERRQKERIDNERRQKQRVEQEKKEKQRLEKQRVEKQKQQKQRKQRQRLEIEKSQQDRKQKEKRQKQKLEQERKERQQRQQQKKQQQRKEQERKQQEKKQQQRKELERKQQQRKQQQQKEKVRLEEQKKRKTEAEASSKAGSTKPSKGKDSKQGGFDYSNMYDDEDIVDEDAPPVKPTVRPAQTKQPAGKAAKAPAKKDDDFEFLNDPVDVDFGNDDDGQKDQYGDDFEPAEGDAAEVNVETKELISHDNLKLLNDYLKGSQYMRKNKINLEPYNNFRHFISLFEEFVQNHQLYFFDDEITKHIFELPSQMEDGNTFNSHSSEIHRSMSEAYYGDLQIVEFNPQTKYIFPISFINPLGVRIIEFLPGFNEFIFVLDQPLPQTQQGQQFFDALVETFCYLFGVTGQEQEAPTPQIQFRILTKENLTILSTFDKYLPNLLVLFNYLYQEKNGKGISIDQYTIERFFYCSNSMDNVYKAIETQQEGLETFYSKLTEKFSANSNILVSMREYSIADPTFTQAMSNEFKMDKDDFFKSPAQTILTLIAIDRVDEQDNPSGRTVIYTEMTKGSPKPILNVFLFATDEESHHYNQKLYEILMAQEETRFQITTYLDFTRHNGLYEYCTWTLPLWAHVMTKKKMKAPDALAVLNLTMLPVYTTFKGQD